MATPTLSDLRYAFYGGGSAAEYAALLEAVSMGRTAAELFSMPLDQAANALELVYGITNPETGIREVAVGDTIARAASVDKFTPNHWYVNSLDSPINQAIADGTVFWVQRPLRPGNINGLSVHVAALAATTDLRVAIAADNNGQPSAILNGGSAQFFMDDGAASTGTKEFSGVSVDIPTWDLYWLGIVAQGGAPQIIGYSRPGRVSSCGTTAPGATHNNGSRIQGGVAGTIPTNPSLSTTPSSACPRIAIRYSN